MFLINLRLKRCKNAVTKLPFVVRYILDQCKTQEMCDKVILENGGTLKFVPDCYKNQCIIKLLIIMLMHQNLSLIAIRMRKCIIKLSILIIPQCSLFLNAIRLKKCVIKLLILVVSYLVLSVIDARLNKYVIKVFLKNLLR